MGRRGDRRRKSDRGSPISAPEPVAARRAEPARHRRWIALVAGAVVLAVVAAYVATRDRGTPAPAGIASSPVVAAIAPIAPVLPAAPGYVGSESCAACHARESAAWRGSQHERAMQAATDATVLGDFRDARFAWKGVTSVFAKREGSDVVTTDGRDGKPVDAVVKYTFGVDPLQQYLVAGDRGRLQALGIAWDARPMVQGGQRWFHLYPDRKVVGGDPLHWTGIDQTWNYQCADCHSTNLRKNYDEATSAYKTSWSEISVGCEACHGPGSRHLAWAKDPARASAWGAAKGLTVALDERRDAHWTIDAASGNAARSTPRTANREIETCARCHSRRGQFSDAWHAGQPLGDAFRPALLEAGLYHVDGQQRDEVYTWGSFLQSRMFAKGVTCSDCHDPHTQKLRAEGNAVCAQCHAPATYDAASHTRHAKGSKGAQCAACHMPTTTYMVVDPRHDHSLRIPRPDRTVALGVPNACNACHADRSPAWAAGEVARRHPKRNRGFQGFAEAFAAAEAGAPGSREALLKVVADVSSPPIVRASAIRRLGGAPPAAMPALLAALDDGDFLVRTAAVNALAAADPDARAQALVKRLDDPVRLVRMDAARALAGEPESRIDEAARGRFERALDEYVAAQRFNADRPEAHATLGDLYAARGRFVEAEASYRQAIALDPTFVPAALNLADLQRGLGHDADAERTIRDAIGRNPDSAAAHHALGLALIRLKRVPEALAELAAAARLAPDDARFAYVRAVALHDTGQRPEALRALRATVARHPYDRDALAALAAYEREAGDLAAARGRESVLRKLDAGIAATASGPAR